MSSRTERLSRFQSIKLFANRRNLIREKSSYEIGYDIYMRITDAQWRAIEPIIGVSKASSLGGRPRIDDRQVINGIIWVLLNGTQWSELPPTMGSHITCWRRYTEWLKKGTWDKIWVMLFKTMERKQLLEWSMALWAGSFVPIKKNV